MKILTAFTSTFLLASFIIDSSPPNTLLVELEGSPSDSLSSESFNVTTTDLCFGSWGENVKFYNKKTKSET